MAYVYILTSTKDAMYYVGSTQDVVRRLGQHNAGTVRSTKSRRPWILRFAQECDNLSQARKLELRIKSWKKRAAIDDFIRESSMPKVGP